MSSKPYNTPMKTIDIAPGLKATLYDTGEMSLRGIGGSGQIELLAWNFDVDVLRGYARIFMNEKDLPEIEFGLDKKAAT